MRLRANTCQHVPTVGNPIPPQKQGEGHALGCPFHHQHGPKDWEIYVSGATNDRSPAISACQSPGDMSPMHPLGLVTKHSGVQNMSDAIESCHGLRPAAGEIRQGQSCSSQRGAISSCARREPTRRFSRRSRDPNHAGNGLIFRVFSGFAGFDPQISAFSNIPSRSEH